MGRVSSEERNRLLKKRIRLGLVNSYREIETFLTDQRAEEKNEITAELLKWRDAYVEAAHVAIPLAEEGEMRHLLEMTVHSNRVSLNTLCAIYLMVPKKESDWYVVKFIKVKEDEIKYALENIDEGNINSLMQIVGRYTSAYINEILTKDYLLDRDELLENKDE